MSGTGKTTISEEICEIRNGKHINTDEIVKDNQVKGEKYFEAIVKAFGQEILRENRRNGQKKAWANDI